MAEKPTGLKANARDMQPSTARQEGLVPAVLYGHGVDNKSLSVDAKEFRRVLSHAGRTTLVSLDVDGTEHTVLIKDIQLHPLKDEVIHADFYQVNLKEKVSANVPLEFTGISSAVKDLGGVFVRNFDHVEVEALPQNLPHDIEVDISHIDTFDKTVTIADLKLPEGVEVLANPDQTIALVQPPRKQEELDQLSEEVTEDVEAVEGVTKEEGEEGEGGEPTEGSDEASEPKSDDG